MDISGVLLKCYNQDGAVMAALSEKLLPMYAAKLTNFAIREDYEIIDAICFLDDCMEFGPESLFQMIAPQAIEKFTEIMEARGNND
jgi:hypothetical protein